MAPRIPPRLLVTIVVVTAVIGTLGVVYLTILSPQLTARRKIQKDLEGAQKRFEETQRNFGDNQDPQAEITLLIQEVSSLEEAVASLSKLTEARLPEELIPEDIDTDDFEQLLRRVQDYAESEAEKIEDRVREAFRKKRIVINRNVEFDSSIKVPAVWGSNQGPSLGGLKKAATERLITLLVSEDLCKLLLDAEIFSLERLKSTRVHRDGEIWELRYAVELELSTQSLVRLAYLLREQEAYYYLRSVKVEPASKTRGSRYFSKDEGDFEDLDELRLSATIVTLRSQTLQTEKVDRREMAREKLRVKEEQRQALEQAAANDPLYAALLALDDPDANREDIFGQDKPWWKFW